jgi:PPOX class probable F420-dependent enzyme
MAINHLASESYVNLETFKKDGSGVKTPVWAAELDGKLVVVSDGTSFKVKRIRNNPKIRLAACDVRGNVRGPWIDGEARIIEDAGQIARAHEALKKKYGWQVWLLDMGARISGRVKRRAFLELSA